MFCQDQTAVIQQMQKIEKNLSFIIIDPVPGWLLPFHLEVVYKRLSINALLDHSEIYQYRLNYDSLSCKTNDPRRWWESESQRFSPDFFLFSWSHVWIRLWARGGHWPPCVLPLTVLIRNAWVDSYLHSRIGRETPTLDVLDILVPCTWSTSARIVRLLMMPSDKKRSVWAQRSNIFKHTRSSWKATWIDGFVHKIVWYGSEGSVRWSARDYAV